jgi:hypothetical protein
MPFNVTAQNNALKSGTGGGIAGIITHAGINTLATAPPTDTTPGTGATAASTEATGGSPAYGRQAVTWGSPASGLVTGSSGTLTFDVPAGTYGFVTYWSASTGNSGTQYQGFSCFGGASPKKGFGTVDSADVTADTVTSSGHGLANGDRVIFWNVVGETIPTGIVEGACYFVVGAATDTFQIALTSGGSAVNLTAQGEVYFEKVVPEVFAGQGQITIAAGALVLDATAI